MSNNESAKMTRTFFLYGASLSFSCIAFFNCSGEQWKKGYIESLVKDGEYSSVREFEEAMRNDYVSDDR